MRTAALRQVLEHFRVGDDGVLDDFGEALFELARRERLQKIDIADDERGLMHDAEQVFSAARVHAGLAAD